jgi:hypothetical protein
VLLTIFSGVVSRLWTLAMIWLRFSLENMSVMVRRGFYHHDALEGQSRLIELDEDCGMQGIRSWAYPESHV